MKRARALLSIAVAILALPTSGAMADVYWAPDAGGDAAIREIVARAYDLPEIEESGTLSAAEAVNIERAKLTGILRSYGYLDARVDVVPLKGGADERRRATVTFAPVAGVRYRLAAVAITGIADDVAARLPMADLSGLATRAVGTFVNDSTLQTLEETIVQRIRDQSYAFARVAAVTRDKDAKIHASIWKLRVETGPSVAFGKLVISGLVRHTPEFVAKAVAFPAGKPFSTDALSDIRRRLQSLGLFRNISIHMARSAAGANQADVHIRLEERLPTWQSMLPSALPGLVLLPVCLLLLLTRELMRTIAGPVAALRGLDLAVWVCLGAAVVLSARQFIVLAGVG